MEIRPWLADCRGEQWCCSPYSRKKPLVNVITLWDRWRSKFGYIAPYTPEKAHILKINVITLSECDSVRKDDARSIRAARPSTTLAQVWKVFRTKW
jgi:hypothetical protein